MAPWILILFYFLKFPIYCIFNAYCSYLLTHVIVSIKSSRNNKIEFTLQLGIKAFCFFRFFFFTYAPLAEITDLPLVCVCCIADLCSKLFRNSKLFCFMWVCASSALGPPMSPCQLSTYLSDQNGWTIDNRMRMRRVGEEI